MKSNRRETPKNSLSEIDIAKLAEVCSRFEALNLQLPILSVFEARETRIRDSILPLRGAGGSALVGELLNFWAIDAVLTC